MVTRSHTTGVHLHRSIALIGIVSLLVVGRASAESTGENALIIIDPASAESMYVGNYYRHARDIPERNIVYMNPTAATYAAFAEANLDGLFGALANHDIAGHVEYIVVMPGAPFAISAAGYVTDGCAAVTRFAIGSAYTMAYLKDDLLNGPVGVGLLNGFYSTDISPIAFDNAVAWRTGEPSEDANARRYFIGAMLGYTGERGNTISEIIELVDRSVAADGTRPDGTFYFMNNEADPARNVRATQFNATVSNIITFGGEAEKIDGVLPIGRHDCLGIMTGAASPNIDGGDFTLIPGAFCDHLTSWAATFDISSQVKVSRWIVKGASGSLGAVQEPCNYTGKFPHANTHLRYFQGMALGEAYFRSARYVPFQMLLYGDPLTRTFTYVPIVSVYGEPEDPVSGELVLIPMGEAPNPVANIDGFDLFIDGDLNQFIPNGQLLTIDTTELDDGYHEMRVLGYDNSFVRAAGRRLFGMVVDNTGRSASITPTTTNGDLTTAFQFDLDAGGGQVDELRLMQGSRVIAASASSPASFTIHGQVFGAGPVQVQAEAYFANGMVVRSEPVTLDIAFDAPSPVGPTPVVFSYTKYVLDNEAFVVELPATFDDDPADATYTIVTAPTQALVHTGSTSAYRIMVPDEDACGTDQFTFHVVTTSGQSQDAVVTIVYESTGVPGDLNGDGCVDQSDLGILLACYEIDDGGDIDGDGDTDQSDLGILLANYGFGC